MFGKKKKNQKKTLRGLEGVTLHSSRDSAGFQFAALLRENRATVMLGVEGEVTTEEIDAWEVTVAQDETVIATEVTAGTSLTLSVTIQRQGKEEKAEADAVLTHLAKVLPDFYAVEWSEAVVTPLTDSEIIGVLEARLGMELSEDVAPAALGVDSVVETLRHVELGPQASVAFEVGDDAELDRMFRGMALGEMWGVVRWTRIFRPADTLADEDEVGRHSGLFVVSVPEEKSEGLEAVVGEIIGSLTPVQRLRVRRMLARQQGAVVSSLGIGALAWELNAAVSA